MKKVVLTYGLISGLIVSTFMSISMIVCYNKPDMMMKNYGMAIGYRSMLLAFLLINFGVKKFRDQHRDGYISFGKAFAVGLFIAFVASTLYVIAWAIVYNAFIPDFMDKYSAMVLKQTAGAGDAAVQAKRAELAQMGEMYKNPLWFVLFTYAEILPVGILVSLICAAVLKRRPRQTVVVPSGQI